MFNNSLLTRLHCILSNPINRPQKFYYKEHEVCIVQPPNISGRERLHFGTSYAFYFFIFTNMTIVLSDSTLRLEPFMKADSLDNSSLKENLLCAQLNRNLLIQVDFGYYDSHLFSFRIF